MQPELVFWIDLNLPPALARWMQQEFNVAATSFIDLGFETTSDSIVLQLAAKDPNIIVITTKDYDFVDFINRSGPPPKILYLNIGKISNHVLKDIINQSLPEAIRIFSETDQYLVEIKIQQ